MHHKKRLGQNFLIDRNVIEKIIKYIGLSKEDYVLEIGPGDGALTKYITVLVNSLTIIEKDTNLINELSLIVEDPKKLKIYNQDVLKFNFSSIKTKIRIIGNLPYNISTEILSNWITNLKEECWFTDLVLMFQKEVADRIIAKYNTSAYGRLSILANWRLNINKICDISPESFSPRPKIQSTLIHFTPKKKFVEIKDPINLEKITRIFFSNRRKMLKKPFNQIFNGKTDLINKFNLNLNLRPQNLDFDTYYKLTIEYEKLRS